MLTRISKALIEVLSLIARFPLLPTICGTAFNLRIDEEPAADKQEPLYGR